jgi:hypothetical protein
MPNRPCRAQPARIQKMPGRSHPHPWQSLNTTPKRSVGNIGDPSPKPVEAPAPLKLPREPKGILSSRMNQKHLRFLWRNTDQQAARPVREDRLSCNIVESVESLRGRLKCVFSAHVIEHLADPNLLWNVGTTILEDGGLIVCFCPNGDPLLEGIYGASRYRQLWGKVHPLLVTSNFLAKEF